MTKLMMNPETRPFLEQPDFLAMIRECAADPSKLTTHIGDARFQKAMQVGLGISLGGAGMGGGAGGGPGASPMDTDAREAPPSQTPAPPPTEPEPEPVRELTEEEKADEQAKAAALKVRLHRPRHTRALRRSRPALLSTRAAVSPSVGPVSIRPPEHGKLFSMQPPALGIVIRFTGQVNVLSLV